MSLATREGNVDREGHRIDSQLMRLRPPPSKRSRTTYIMSSQSLHGYKYILNTHKSKNLDDDATAEMSQSLPFLRAHILSAYNCHYRTSLVKFMCCSF